MNNFSINYTLGAYGGSVGGSGTVITIAGTAVIGRVPTDAHGGGARIVEAYAFGRNGTVQLDLIDYGAAGTANGGTICAFPAVFTNVPNVGTPADYWVDGGNYLGLVQGVGTVGLPVAIHLNLVMGR